MIDFRIPITLSCHEDFEPDCDVCKAANDMLLVNSWKQVNYRKFHECMNKAIDDIWSRICTAYFSGDTQYDDKIKITDQIYLIIKKKIVSLGVTFTRECSKNVERSVCGEKNYYFRIFWGDNNFLQYKPLALRNTLPSISRVTMLWDQAVKGEYCDILVHARAGTLHVHKNVLATYSEYFKKLIDFPRTAETPFEINIDANVKIASAFLEYLYIGQLTSLRDPTCYTILDLYKLFVLCDFYQEEPLAKDCLLKMRERADSEQEKLFLKIKEKPIHEKVLINLLKSIEVWPPSFSWFEKALDGCERSFFDQLLVIAKNHYQLTKVDKFLNKYAAIFEKVEKHE